MRTGKDRRLKRKAADTPPAASGFEREACEELIEGARRKEDAWQARRRRAALLEALVARLDASRQDDLVWLFGRLGLRVRDERLDEDVLRQGYTSRDLPVFSEEFLRRLERNRRIHRLLRGGGIQRKPPPEIEAFARQDCRLLLARYLFEPGEVAERVLSRCRLSRGMPRELGRVHSCGKREAERLLRELPRYEAEILRLLARESHIFWVAPGASERVNSLLEYPLGTVVLTLKPPGSDREFEFKRAGRPARRPLSVIHGRNGQPVPPSHRLDGGSMGWQLDWESGSTALISRLHRLVFASEAPISRVLAVNNIYTIPVGRRRPRVLDFLTSPEAYGDGYQQMREALSMGVDSFFEEGGWEPPALGGDLGLSVQFVNRVAPSQGLLADTSSFRLDLLCRYLSDQGPELYFKRGLKRSFTREDARRFALALLDETLGVCQPPEVEYRSHEQYVAAALAVPRNRSRADRWYQEAIEGTGRLWGLLLAFRGTTRGESFVGRNVGLRSRWREGEWRVQAVFMDHDDVHLAGKRSLHFRPLESLPDTRRDAVQIFGLPDRADYPGIVGRLARIYRVSPQMRARGDELLVKAIGQAYGRSREAAESDPQVRELFEEIFLSRLNDWDETVREFLSGDEAWAGTIVGRLKAKGYNKTLREEMVRAVLKHSDFLQRMAFLFDD